MDNSKSQFCSKDDIKLRDFLIRIYNKIPKQSDYYNQLRSLCEFVFDRQTFLLHGWFHLYHAFYNIRKKEWSLCFYNDLTNGGSEIFFTKKHGVNMKIYNEYSKYEDKDIYYEFIKSHVKLTFYGENKIFSVIEKEVKNGKSYLSKEDWIELIQLTRAYSRINLEFFKKEKVVFLNNTNTLKVITKTLVDVDKFFERVIIPYFNISKKELNIPSEEVKKIIKRYQRYFYLFKFGTINKKEEEEYHILLETEDITLIDKKENETIDENINISDEAIKKMEMMSSKEYQKYLEEYKLNIGQKEFLRQMKQDKKQKSNPVLKDLYL